MAIEISTSITARQERAFFTHRRQMESHGYMRDSVPPLERKDTLILGNSLPCPGIGRMAWLEGRCFREAR